MNLQQLERRLQIHLAFSESIGSSLRRLWDRPLTEVETSVVDSGAVCCSFMGLDAMDNKLVRAEAASAADAEFSYLKDTVTKSRTEVLRAMEQVATQLGVGLKVLGGENLLSVEARLVKDAKQRFANP